jgi:hypothetical protein
MWRVTGDEEQTVYVKFLHVKLARRKYSKITGQNISRDFGAVDFQDKKLYSILYET